MTVYMAATSVKLQWLAGMFHDICNVKKAKVILFHDWPLPLWHTTSFVMNLRFTQLRKGIMSAVEQSNSVYQS